MRANSPIFLSVAAQGSNLGDLVLRRHVLQWAYKTYGEVHVYLGGMPSPYVQALEIPATARKYRSKKAFAKAMAKAVVLNRPGFIVSPGPVLRFDRRDIVPRAISNLLLAAAIRMRGGRVHVFGRAVRGKRSFALHLERALARIARPYWLRDPLSGSLVRGDSTLMPDLAFAAHLPIAASDAPRSFVAVSLRGDIPTTPKDLNEVVAAIRSGGLEPLFVTQVGEDDDQHEQLASHFGASAVRWGSRSHSEQLDRVMSAYATCSAVVTNRLHAALFAARAGAAVFIWNESENGKLNSTLRWLLPVESTETSIGKGSAGMFRAEEIARLDPDIAVAEGMRSLNDSLADSQLDTLRHFKQRATTT